jgi:hypothetical protein
MPLQASGEIEFQKDHEHLRRMQLGMPDQFIDAGGRRAERLDHAGAVVVAGRGRGRKIWRLLKLNSRRNRPAGERRERLDDVCGFGDEDRPRPSKARLRRRPRV